MTTTAVRMSPARRWLAVTGAAAATAFFGTAATLGLALPGDDGVDAAEIAFLAAFLSYALVGGLVAWHRPGNPVGWLLLATGTTILLSAALDGYAYYALVAREGAAPGGVWARWAQQWLFALAWSLGTTLPLLLFPDGRPPTRRWSWLIRLTAGVVALNTFTAALMPGPIGDTVPVANPVGITAASTPLTYLDDVAFWVCGAITVLGLVSLVVRWRLSTGGTRRRLAWLGLGGLTALFLIVLGAVADALGASAGAGSVLVAAALATLPVSVAVAILRAGLFDIQALFTRGIVYAALTVVIIATYAAGIAVTPAIVGREAGTAASIVAAALAAVLLNAVRERMQGALERGLFGERRRPYRVLSDLGAVTRRPDAAGGAPAEMAALLRRSLRLPYVAVHLEGRPVVESGVPTAWTDEFALPLVDGRLVVARRDPGDEFTAAERDLLVDAARQVAYAARAEALADDLQVARERLVRAREQERLRIRRDLHDGLGPLLGAVTLRLDVLRAHVPETDPEGRALADRAKRDVRVALADVRRLIEGLRPAALDTAGLRPALTEQAAALLGPAVTVSVECSDDVHLAGPAAEVAAYRIVVEALTNIARHSRATHVEVEVRLSDTHLTATVTDDGRGFGPPHRDGLGLRSMRERAAELGGHCDITSRPGRGVTVSSAIPREEP
ncbi:sensor histidine kinase [Actinoplanes sp. NPDC051633]|uniref:sensor histidine kinase n=1 Tax=Actinoplanes sp. NPDC051633 TaxID=3155670 RepID=UPI00342E3C01